MASTVRGRAITEAHRLAQLQLGKRTVAQMVDIFSVLAPAALDATFPKWLRASVPVMQAQRIESAQLAGKYLGAFRATELTRDRAFTPVMAKALDLRSVTTSLLVTGPVSIKKAVANGIDLEQAVDTAMASSARAAMRHVLDGGRDTLSATVAADSQALGWARATSGDPCAFCAMLAGLGPVYSEDSIDIESHDGCSCTAEPVYRRDQDWPQGSERWADLWDEAKRTAAADPELDTETAFRRALSAA